MIDVEKSRTLARGLEEGQDMDAVISVLPVRSLRLVIDDLRSLSDEVDRQRDLLNRAMAIIAHAICCGMPVTEEVARVRNEIVAK